VGVVKPRAFKPVNKYGTKRVGGYASKREAAYAAELANRKAAGEVLDWLEQVGIKLPGGSKYVADFLVFMADGTTKIVEVKGMQTDVWRMKLRLLEEARPVLFGMLEVVR
jgi:hypothetical protein